MSVELAQEHIAWNAEAVERCAVLSTEGSCPSHVRQLFHALGPQQPTNSCLLQQIGRLVMSGLASSADACVKASETAYGVASAGSAVRTAIAKAAATVSPHAAVATAIAESYNSSASTQKQWLVSFYFGI